MTHNTGNINEVWTILQAGEPPDEKTGLHDRLAWARRVLGLGLSVTRNELKGRTHQLLQVWHPDHAPSPDAVHTEVTRKVLKARDIILDYCDNYRFSFSQEEINHYLPPEEWLKKRFWEDP
ncbi:MAG: J domain-containing protein [Magnetococcus sp. THC-1_WYH]